MNCIRMINCIIQASCGKTSRTTECVQSWKKDWSHSTDYSSKRMHRLCIRMCVGLKFQPTSSKPWAKGLLDCHLNCWSLLIGYFFLAGPCRFWTVTAPSSATNRALCLWLSKWLPPTWNDPWTRWQWPRQSTPWSYSASVEKKKRALPSFSNRDGALLKEKYTFCSINNLKKKI